MTEQGLRPGSRGHCPGLSVWSPAPCPRPCHSAPPSRNRGVAGARGATPRPRVETRFCLYSTSRSRGSPAPTPRPPHSPTLTGPTPPTGLPGRPRVVPKAPNLPPGSQVSRALACPTGASCLVAPAPSPAPAAGRGSGPASGPGLQPPGLTGNPPARPYHARFSLARPPRSLDHSEMFTEHLHVLSSVPKASRCRMDLAGWPRRQRVWCL